MTLCGRYKTDILGKSLSQVTFAIFFANFGQPLWSQTEYFFPRKSLPELQVKCLCLCVCVCASPLSALYLSRSCSLSLLLSFSLAHTGFRV